MNSYILPKILFGPTLFMDKFVEKFNFVINDGRLQVSNIQTYESLI